LRTKTAHAAGISINLPDDCRIDHEILDVDSSNDLGSLLRLRFGRGGWPNRSVGNDTVTNHSITIPITKS
jgi:hypothetical protein